MVRYLFYIVCSLFLFSCVSSPQVDVDDTQGSVEQIESEGIAQEREVQEQEQIELELVEAIDPIELEVINIGHSQDMDYPPFAEIDLEPAAVDGQGHFIELISLTIDNTKFGDDPMTYVFRPDGLCYERHQQMSYINQEIIFNDLYQYRGTYSYNPRTYRLEMTINEYQEPGRDWENIDQRLISDYYLINQEGLYDVFFQSGEDNWQKLRSELYVDSQEDLYINRGMRISDDKFTFYQERRQGESHKEEPDYQRARQYDLRGRAADPAGEVFYLEDSLLFKNDYVYFYSIPQAILLRLTLGE